jgi:hypothetical protein
MADERIEQVHISAEEASRPVANASEVVNATQNLQRAQDLRSGAHVTIGGAAPERGPRGACGCCTGAHSRPPQLKVVAKMESDTMGRSFERLGIPPHDYSVLKLLPLIYVAWADGKMEFVKKERIQYYAAGEYDLSPAGMAVLDLWLTKRPTHAYIAEGLHDIYSLALADDDIEVNFSELPALLSYAEAIARSTAKALDQPAAVSADADRALEEIARELHIDHGESWAKLLDELS